MTQRMKQYVKERWIFCIVILSLVVLIGATVTWTAAESQIFSVKQDDGAYTAAGATSGVSVTGGFFDDVAPDSVSEGDVGALRMSANRNLYGTIRDAAGNERGANVTSNNDLETQVSAPLGSAAAAASVSIAPPTDAMFRVSDDTATNALTNPMFFQISDATHGAEVTATNELEIDIASQTLTAVKISDDTAANTVTNPIFTQCSPTAAANTVSNPFFASVSDDGATNTATNPMFMQITNATAVNSQAAPIYSAVSDDTSANAIGNPMWFEITDGTHSAEITATNELEVDIASQTLTAVKVSDDANANTQANPMYVTCSDDAAANAVGNPMYVSVSDDAAVNAVNNPIFVQSSPTAAANTVANPFFASVSDDGATNTATNPMFMQLTNATAVNSQAAPIYAAISDDTSANAVGNPIYAAISDDTAANTVTNPMFTQPTNGTNGVDVLAAIADDVALTNNPMVAQCMLGLYDGVTMDMGRAGASGELQVTDIAVRPGENSGDGLVETRKLRLGHVHDAKMTHVTINEVEQIVCHSMEVIEYPNFCIYLANNDSTDHALTDMDVQVSPDDFATASSTMELTEIATCDTLAVGVGCVGCYANNAYRYVRVNATGLVDHGVSSLDCWITGNMN